MTQTARPASDISVGSWTDEGSSFNDGSLFTSVQEASQDGNTSYVTGAGGAGTFEVKLGTVTDPVSSALHVVKLWGMAVGSGAPENVDVELYEGTTLRATVASNWAPGRSAYAETTYTLSAAEADAISDYTDLRVRVVEGSIGGAEEFRVTQIYMEFPDAVGTIEQLHYRIRSGDTFGINVDDGWQAAIDVNATMDVEAPFRIRFELEEQGGGSKTASYKLQYNWSGSAGWNDVAAPGTPELAAVPVVQFQDSGQYADNVATTNILAGSAGAFVAGSGEESNNTASVVLASTNHTEFEFCVLIRKLFGAIGGFTSDGQTVQFRIVESDNTVLTTYTKTPTITINHPVGLVGGVFAETVGNVGPIRDTNGNLYVLVEHATLPAPIIPSILKSTDGGDTWIPQDDSDWPSVNNELEAADLHYVDADDLIYMGWTDGTDPNYRSFQTSGHGTPDAFTAAVVEVAAVTSITEQNNAIIKRSDGTIVMFYSSVATNSKLYYKIRSAGGTWGSELDLEVTASIEWVGPHAVIGASDKIHIVYSESNGGSLYYKNLDSGNTLSGRTELTTDTATDCDFPLIKPVYWDDGGTEKVMLCYKKNTADKLWTRVVTSGSVGAEFAVSASDAAVAFDIASSTMPTAQMAVDGTTVYLIYSRTDQDIYITTSINGAAWAADTEIEDAVTCDLISASIFTHSVGNGSAKVLGYIYADSRYGAGYTGDVVYNEYEIVGDEIIALDVLTLASAPIDLTVVPGAVTVPQDVLTLVSAPIDLSVLNPPPTATVPLDILTLVSAPIDLTVVPGNAIVPIDVLTLISAPIDLSIIPGAITTPLDVLTLISAPIDLSVVPGAVTIVADVLTLTSTPIDLSIIPGAVTITQDVLTLVSAPIDLTVNAPAAGINIPLDVLTLTSAPIDLTVVPGSVTITQDVLTLASSIIDFSVVPGNAIVPLDVLTLASTIIDLSVVPGAVTIPQDILTLASTIIDLSISAPGSGETIALDVLTLGSTIIDLTVVPGSVQVNADVLSLISTILDISIVTASPQIVALDTLTLVSAPIDLSVVIPIIPPLPTPTPTGQSSGGVSRGHPVSPLFRQQLLRGLFPEETKAEEEKEIMKVIDLIDQLETKELYEKSKSTYNSALRANVKRLWLSGDIFAFRGDMLTSVQDHLNDAWVKGMKECGISANEISDEEEEARKKIIIASLSRIQSLAEFVLDAKESGKKVKDTFYRITVWSNRWNEAFMLARTMACADQKMEWVIGPTEQHCEDCSKYNGRIYRNSTWKKWDALPQTRRLSCSGYNCLCELVTTDKPYTPGRPPNPSN